MRILFIFKPSDGMYMLYLSIKKSKKTSILQSGWIGILFEVKYSQIEYFEYVLFAECFLANERCTKYFKINPICI